MRAAPLAPRPCEAIAAAIVSGLLRPLAALDADGREVVVFVPTEAARRWFGPDLSPTEAAA